MRRLLIGATAVLLLLVAAAAVVRRSLAEGELRGRIEARLTAMLGSPVSIGRVDIALLPRVAVVGSDVRVGEGTAQAPSVAIGRVRILPGIGALLSGALRVREVQLEGFVASALRDAGGGWQLPPALPAPTPDDGSAIAVERVRLAGARIRVFDRSGGGLRERSSIDDIHAEVVVDDRGLRLSAISGRVGASKVAGDATVGPKDATLSVSADAIADRDLPAFLGLLGADRPEGLTLVEAAALSATIRVDRAAARLSGTGTLRAPEVQLGSLRLRQFEAQMSLSGSRTVFEPAGFTLYGGRHRGRIAFDTSASPARWTLDSRVDGLDAGAFLEALNGGGQKVDGTVALTAALRGRLGEPLAQTVRGRARVEMADGVIRDFPLLAAVGRALQLAEQSGADTVFSRLSATLAVEGGRASTDGLLLVSSDLRLQAAGRIGADRSLALRGIAVLSPERSRSAIASVHELSGLRNPRGEVEVPLTISGTIEAPSFFIDMESIIRKGIADELRRRLRRIIR